MAFVRWANRLRVSGIVAVMVASCGCKWLPTRSEIHDRKVHGEELGAKEAELPPLPELRSIPDDEAFRPAAPTPLLDAVAERDAAIKRAFEQEISAEPPSNKPQITLDPAPHIKPAKPDENLIPGTSKLDSAIEPASFEPPKEIISEIPGPSQVKNVSESSVVSEGFLWDYVLNALAQGSTTQSELEKPVTPQFDIADLRICRRVYGFGRTEPISGESLAPGQMVLLYCELEGVREEAEPGGVRSQISSSVAILAANGDEPLWRFDLGSAEDHCQRHRRDFFVNYRVTIPENLAPGNYRIRLAQKDLVADRSAERTVTFTLRAK